MMKSMQAKADSDWEELNHDETRPLIADNRKIPLGQIDENRTADPNVLPNESLWTRYCELLEHDPVLVKSLTAFVIVGSGDIGAQGMEHLRGTNHTVGVDLLRVARFGAIGLFGAPWSHYYFYYLDYYLPPTVQPFTRRTFLKVIIDQFIQAPLLLFLMISGLSLLAMEGWDGVKKDIRDSFWTSLVANWKFWLPASFVNLAFVRPELRVLFLNCGFLVWIIILSMILNRDSK